MPSLVLTQALVSACMCATLALGLLADPAAAAEKQNVLVLAGRDSQQPAHEQFMSGFRAGLSARGGEERLQLYTEFFDFVRFPQAEHKMLMRQFLQEKYAATRIDLLISTSRDALDFVLQHRNALFPNVPYIFAFVSPYELPALRLPNDVIGILERYDFAKTLEMAQRLQPQARRVVVVSGAAPYDKMLAGLAGRELQVNGRGLEINYLSGLPLGRLLEEVAHLPKDTIVLYLTVFRDGAGESFKQPDVVQKVAAASGAPVYSVFGSYFGRGIVGGHIVSFEAAGDQAAAVALRLLSGERPEQVGTALGPEGSYLADVRQLQRWNLDESRLPAGTIVRFREPSIWDLYHWHITAAALVIIVQSVLIAALILQRRRRRIAEVERRAKTEALGESEARFRTMADTAPVLMWMSDTEKLCTFFNKSWLDFTGRTLDQELGNGWVEGVHPDDRERCFATYTDAFDARREFTMEYRLRRHDGEYRWVYDKGLPRRTAEGAFLGYIGCADDITPLKEAELTSEQHRAELAHVARLSTMGELAASLAHELNQPLAAILGNAETAQKMLGRDNVDLAELRAICDDIVDEDHRATEVMRRMRALVSKEPPTLAPLDVQSVIGDVVRLLHGNAVLRQCRVLVEAAPGLPPVMGDRIELQQVVLNLLVNAFDAMSNCPRGRTRSHRAGGRQRRRRGESVRERSRHRNSRR